MDAKQVPLRELLASVPADARLLIDDADGLGSRSIPVGRLCQEAAAALAEPTVPSDCADSHQPVAWADMAVRGEDKGLSWTPGHFHKTPLYTAPPQRKPLAEWQINDLMADIDPEDVDSWSFRQGVYAAEKHHGIKP